MEESPNKRIAKNTVILYMRMAVMMLISFFTARITLNALGVVDYGINNVVERSNVFRLSHKCGRYLYNIGFQLEEYWMFLVYFVGVFLVAYIFEILRLKLMGNFITIVSNWLFMRIPILTM